MTRLPAWVVILGYFAFVILCCTCGAWALTR